VHRLRFNSQEITSKYFLWFRMKITSFSNGINNYPRKFQIISNYTTPILSGKNFLLKKSGKLNVPRIEVSNLRGGTYSYINLEMGEH
jgi:hypothetical protein